jgi:D-glycero-alpha-D-manno-heptose 1-phosphate guanylyltransferase
MTEKGPGGPGLINAGLHLLRRDLPARRPFAGAFSLEAEILAHPELLNIRAHVTAAPFIDIGTPEDFACAQSLIPAWAAG